ncbi:hypothetical protein DL96DRAFT_1627415 [Flagelloscypha sp. PMI_526]|nr:hypothetical protein DL96DRAFT_1627415 [Flagelloscypha sp. PMI_526]
MFTIDNLPDELLERILFLSTARDIDGHIARTVNSVSCRWHRITSPILYRNLAYSHNTGRSSAKTPHRDHHKNGKSTLSRWSTNFPFPRRSPPPTRADSTRLFSNLSTIQAPIRIQHLLLHDNLVPTDILTQLADFSCLTLRTLTIWPDEDMKSRLRFFDQTTACFPHLTHLTFVGNIRVREDVKTSGAPGSPRFPSLTNMHLVGSILYPPFAHPDDIPLISTIRYSHLTYDDAFVVLRTLEHGFICVGAGLCSAGDFTPRIRHWSVLHAPSPDGTEQTTKQAFNQQVKDVEDLLKQPWARGYTWSIREDLQRRPHNRTSDEDSWGSVVLRLAEDDV